VTTVDCLVIGAGVIGLAAARALPLPGVMSSSTNAPTP
jgi:NADPH-dependent 2,4-dienoyl-CoA reductase/sulfur reductase-like enzyme